MNFDFWDLVADITSSLYDCSCNIYQFLQQTDQFGITKNYLSLVHENIPCRISHKTTEVTQNTLNFPELTHSSRLFLPSNIDFLPGSYFYISFPDGSSSMYHCCGMPFKYKTHTEVSILLAQDTP